MSIKQNDSYQKEGAFSSLKNFRYVPRSYSGPVREGTFKGKSPSDPGYTEDIKKAEITKYGRELMATTGSQPGKNFLSPSGDLGAPVPLPADYGPFMEPMSFSDSKVSWGTPNKPVIRNITSGGVTGQYVQDTDDKNLLVKSIRGKNLSRDDAIRAGRSGQMWQIDHIMPLTLGGADTDENRQLLSSGVNDVKTRAQAVAYTLYGYGDITLNEARSMAMQWQDRDMNDIPQPNNSTGYLSDTDGKSGIEIAREVQDRWKNPKVGIKEVLAEIPDTMKNLGEGWLPDPVRELVKGAISGFSFGFLPYELDDDVSKGSKTAGHVGTILGTVGSFMLGSAALGLGAKIALRGYKGAALLSASKLGYKGMKGIKGVKAYKDAQFMASLGKTAAGAKKVTSLNNLGFLNKAAKLARTEKVVSTAQRAAKIGMDAAFVGQVHRFVDNHASLAILGGKEFEKKQESVIKNLMGDFAFGAVTGLPSPTLKGVAQSAGLGFTMGYINDPEDPVGALTDAAVFGSMHAMGSYKTLGFNNVKIFGGKKGKVTSPKVDIALENAMNDSVYKSLRYYNPELPKLKPGAGTAFAKKTSPAEIQKIVDSAEAKVWERLFFGKDMSKNTVKQVKKELSERSKQIDKDLALNEIPELTGMDRFSISARRDRANKVKAADKTVVEQFGKDYQNKIKKQETALPEEMISDIQAALTEIKRIKVAGRQLYKGGLSKLMREKADLNDLLSFSIKDVNKRFREQEEFLNPSKVKKVVENIDDSFFKNTLNNKGMNPNSKYPNGDFAVTGVGLNDVNIKATTDFMNKVATGEASRNIIIVRRPDLAPIMKMQNEMVSVKNKEAKEGKDYGVDPFPENILQAFGIIKNAKTGEITTVPIPGFVASEHRTNIGKQAFNKNLTENQKPLKYSKDPISKSMKDNDMDFLITNLDPRFTAETIRSGRPFMPLNVNDANWIQSKQLQQRITKQEVSNPASVDIADFNAAKSAKEVASSISKIKKSVIKPAADYIPKPGTNKQPVTESVAVPQESTRVVLKTMENSLNVTSPAEVKAAFEHNFGSKLNDSQANYFFNNRTKLNTEEGVAILNKLAKKGNMDGVSLLKLNATNKYLDSGFVEYHGIGKALFKLPIVGRGSQFGGAITAAKRKAFGIPEAKAAPVVAEGTNAVSPMVEAIVTAKAAHRGEAPTVEVPLVSRGRGRETTEGITKQVPVKVENAKELETGALATSANDLYLMAKERIAAFMPKGGSPYVEKFKKIKSKKEIAKEAKEAIERKKAGKPAKYEPDDTGARVEMKELLATVRRLEPSGVTAKQAKQIKETIEPRLIGDINLRVSESFQIPLKEVEKIMDKIISGQVKGKPKKEKIKLSPEMQSKLFFDKKSGTGKSEYDRLVMERRASGSEFLNWIKSGRSKDGLSESEIAAGIKKAEPGTYEHAFKHTLDTLLSSQFGKRYAKADQIKEMIGRAMGATGSAGRKIKGLGELGNAKKAFEPYEWTKDYLNTIATGNKKAREAVIAREKKALIKAGKDADAKLTDAEISELGLEAGVEGGGFKGFKVENIMLEDKIKNMSRGDQKFMPGLTSILLGGSKNTGSGAIRKGVEDARNVMQFLVSSHSKYVAAGKKPAAGKETRMNQYISLMPERGFTGRWANLSKEKKAEVTDKTNTYFDDIFKKYKKKFETSEAKVVPVEKNIAKLENDIKKAEERLQVEPQERSNWETDEFLISNINTMKNEVSKLKSTLKKAIQDGGGGPGLYDGAGGPKWDWLKSKVGSAKNALSNKWKKLGESTSSTIYPSDSNPRTGKYTNPVTNTKTGEPKGPSYNPIKPTTKTEAIKQRVGKYVNPVQKTLVEGASSGIDTSPDANFPGGYKEIKKGVFNAPERRTEEVNQFVPPQYAEPLSNAARRHGVDENGLAAMVQTESSWNPNATNPESSATGFGQIVDGTYEYIKKNYKDFDRLNPSEALDAMAWYLQDVGKRIGSNNFTEQVKAYYMGPAAYNDRYSPRWAERLRNAEAHVDRMSRFL